LVLDNLNFKGEVRALTGPVKGEGSFAIAGQRYPYRFSTSRQATDGGMKVRLAVNPPDQPLTADVDLPVLIPRGQPRFEGAIQFGRTVGRAPAGGQEVIADSWHVSSRVKGDSAAAAFEQIEFQYGPDDRAIKLKGNANLSFGQQPQMTASLSSPQIDVD